MVYKVREPLSVVVGDTSLLLPVPPPILHYLQYGIMDGRKNLITWMTSGRHTVEIDR